ncbi:hypothetical protein RUMOBE_02791 [Blautia obeum ATCC 29174]|uniref:Uncharacterized protein n=1 Tax=Blautia obeum ATCC 29174 TaxID=411459 RepID=A5ZUV7_9FIRM|nr:hypothetical protein RUMOBE_02791 [Blautia obeum ATCC 29174]
MKSNKPASGSVNSFSLKQIFDDGKKEEHSSQYTGNSSDAINNKAGEFCVRTEASICPASESAAI